MRVIDKGRVKNSSMAVRICRLILAAGMAGACTQAAAFFEVDGKFGGAAEGYSLGFDVSFRLDTGSVVQGGKLFFGTDTGGSGDHYMYFAMPKDFVDNTLGANSLGWGGKAHTMTDLVNSDSLGRLDKNNPANSHPLVLTTTTGTLDLQVDYLASDEKKGAKGHNPTFYRSAGIGASNESDVDGNTQDNSGLTHSEGAVGSGDASGVKEVATSMEYNVNRILASSDPSVADDVEHSTDKSPEGFIADSPRVDANYECDASLTGEEQSICNDWVFEVGYEFRFASDLFDDGWDDPNRNHAIDGGTALTYVDLGESHVSPSKTTGNFQDVEISCDSSFGAGCAGGSPIPPTANVPEPDTAALLGIGLALLGARVRRRDPARRALAV